MRNGQFWPTACHTFFESSACNLKYFGTFLVHPVMHQFFAITLKLNCHYYIALCHTTSLVLKKTLALIRENYYVVV